MQASRRAEPRSSSVAACAATLGAVRVGDAKASCYRGCFCDRRLFLLREQRRRVGHGRDHFGARGRDLIFARRTQWAQ